MRIIWRKVHICLHILRSLTNGHFPVYGHFPVSVLQRCVRLTRTASNATCDWMVAGVSCVVFSTHPSQADESRAAPILGGNQTGLDPYIHAERPSFRIGTHAIAGHLQRISVIP